MKKKLITNEQQQQRLWPSLEKHVSVHKGLLILNYFKHGFGSIVCIMQENTCFVCEQGCGFAVYLFLFFLVVYLTSVKE